MLKSELIDLLVNMTLTPSDAETYRRTLDTMPKYLLQAQAELFTVPAEGYAAAQAELLEAERRYDIEQADRAAFRAARKARLDRERGHEIVSQ